MQMIRVVTSRRKIGRARVKKAMLAVLQSNDLVRRVEEALHRCDFRASDIISPKMLGLFSVSPGLLDPTARQSGVLAHMHVSKT